ncbi:unnamed protein product [Meloidogyne enterolobii]|uniref:Uncharacterized protein n=1 Tax=Meloidogyne enterolobii TaxID=390850 RepID=A0ACB0YE99_MELEN
MSTFTITTFLRPTTILFLIFVLIQVWEHSSVQAQYVDRFTSGTILNNLWRKRRDLTEITNKNKIRTEEEDNENFLNSKQANKRWADFYTSGTILNNLWRKKRMSERQQYLTHPTVDIENSEINSDIIPRFKRQLFYVDGLTSGSILNNLWGRKK